MQALFILTSERGLFFCFAMASSARALAAQPCSLPIRQVRNVTDTHTPATMTIRQATPADVPQMMDIFAAARQFMAATGNPNQWAATYPSAATLLSDIASGDSYVCVADGSIVATFVLRGGADPTYDVIYHGAWPNDRPYATIHRIASNGRVRGIFRAAMRYALERYSTLRIDTHRDNRVMQHAITDAGFVYCGIIHCWNGDERLAYQYN